jgi:hypothetical protein
MTTSSTRTRRMPRLLPRTLATAIPLLMLARATIASAQAPGDPIGPKDPGDVGAPASSGGVMSGTAVGTPAGAGPGDEAGKAPAPGTTVVAPAPAAPTVTAAPAEATTVVIPNQAPAMAAPEEVVAQTQTGRGARGAFMDTRLTWTFGDDDILHRTGAQFPLSPLPNIGDRDRYRLFFDNLNSRFAGRENLAHLVLYRRMPSFIEGLETEAALVLRFDMADLAANANLSNATADSVANRPLTDAGSYIRLFYETRRRAPDQKSGLSMVFFPLDTDRFRLGYLYEISWGGTNAARNESIFPKISGASPGLKVQYDGFGWYVFGGFKTAQIIQTQTNLAPGGQAEVEAVRVRETNYGFLGGGGADLGPYLHLDVGGGYFQQGRFENPDLQPPPGVDRQAPRVFTYGGSSRLVFHKGMSTPQSIDFLLYRNDPAAPMLLFRPETYQPGEFAYSIALEASRLYQNLHDGSPGKFGATTLQRAQALALQGVVKAGYARFGVAGIYRDLPFILRNVPGYVPFEAIDETPGSGISTQSELFLSGSFDYFFPSLRLRPGIGGGVQLPAAFRAESEVGNAPANRTVVVRRQGDIGIQPLGQERKAITQVRASLRWDLSDIIAAIGWVQLIHDPVATFVTRDPAGNVGLRTFQSPTFLGFGITVQARY